MYIIAFRVIVERLLSHLAIRYSEKRVGEIRLFFLCDEFEQIQNITTAILRKARCVK